jgi:predicted methyltransferase
MRTILCLVVFALTLASCQKQNSGLPVANAPEQSGATTASDAKLMQVVAGPQRPEAERARDAYRHPRETLEFFGITDSMKIVELSAGKGWYTAILGPFLNPNGELTATTADPNSPPDSEGTKNAQEFAARLNNDRTNFAKVTPLVADWKNGDVKLGAESTADMVLTFRNLHGWIRDGIADKVFAASFRVLKHGGVLGVEEHRAKPDASTDPKTIGDSGYVPESLVIKLAELAGFKLAAKSEINANPKDTKDYPKGVWTLPPTLRLGDTDRDKYMAIGESDRMTLKFVKP